MKEKAEYDLRTLAGSIKYIRYGLNIEVLEYEGRGKKGRKYSYWVVGSGLNRKIISNFTEFKAFIAANKETK